MTNDQLDHNRYRIIFDYLELGFVLKTGKNTSLIRDNGKYYMVVSSKSNSELINYSDEKQFISTVESLSIDEIKKCFIDSRVESYNNKLENMDCDFNPLEFDFAK